MIKGACPSWSSRGPCPRGPLVVLVVSWSQEAGAVSGVSKRLDQDKIQVAAILNKRLGEGEVRSLLGGVGVQFATHVPAGAGADPGRLIASSKTARRAGKSLAIECQSALLRSPAHVLPPKCSANSKKGGPQKTQRKTSDSQRLKRTPQTETCKNRKVSFISFISMANRQLTEEELDKLFSPMLEEVRSKLVELSAEDDELHWALRRKLFKELTYDERGKPTHRAKLKAEKRAEQDNKCSVCGASLPAKYTVLDRLEAMKGYTLENTRLICQDCDTQAQKERGYT